MSVPPWGVLSDKRIYKLVVRENDRPDRFDLDIGHKHGLTDQIWEIMQAAWQKDANLRPTFVEIIQSWEMLHQESAQNLVQPGSSSGSGASQTFYIP